MSLTALSVPFGAPSTALLAARVEQAKEGDVLAPVTVVVADNVAGVALRRSLAARHEGVVAVSFLTLHRLAEQLAGARLAAAGRAPVSPPVIASAVRAVLELAPGIFEPVRDHPATEEALVAAYRELAPLTPAALDALSRQSARAADVVRVVVAAREALAAAWFDEADLLHEAARSQRDDLAGLGPVVVHLPRALTPPAAALLTALARHVDVTVILGATGDERADRAIHDAAARLGVAVERAGEPGVPGAARIVSVSDPDEEARAAVRELVGAARQGVAFGRMAVLYGASEPYGRLLHEHLDAAGIPRNGAAVRTVGDALLGRTLRGLLALPDTSFRRRDVLAVLSCNHIVGDDDRPVPARAWERVARAAGVVDGDDWRDRLAAFAAFSRAEADAAEASGEPARAAAGRRDADAADALAAFVRGLRRILGEGHALRTWSAHVEWAFALLRRFLGDESRRLRWPPEEQHAAVRVEEALDRLASLDAAGGPAPTLDVFRRSLDRELSAALPRVGRLGEGVFVGHVRGAAGVAFDRVVVVGLAEGTFPSRGLEDSLLPDRERAATGGELPPRAARVDDDHRALLAVLAAAGQATLTYPRGDLRRRGERPASRWLLDAARALAGRPSPVFTGDLASFRGEPWYEEVPSFTGGLVGTPFPPTAVDYDLAALLASGARGRRVALEPAIADDPIAAAGVELALSRASDRFTRFDGNLAGVDAPMPSPVERVVSPTALEAWVRCPHAYLLERVLRVEVPPAPERVYEITPIDKGTLVHRALEAFLLEAMAAGPVPATWDDAHRLRLRAIGEQLCDEYEARGLTGRAVFWRRDRARILAELDRFLEQDELRRAQRFGGVRPVAAELDFGSRGGGRPPVEVTLEDGRVVRFAGKVDRVDRAEDGSLVVVDYKTGSTTRFKDITADDPVRNGASLQLPVYGAAARAALDAAAPRVHAAYWFVSTAGRWEWIGYDVTDEVDKHLSAAVTAITQAIEAGVFPARPSPNPPYHYVDCWYCNPDGLGTSDRRRDWERKRADPALRAYAELVEPGDGDR